MRRILPFLAACFLISGFFLNSIIFTSCEVVTRDTTIGNGNSISGHVFDNRGFPYGGVKVYFSKTNFTTTLADGSFTLTNISYPATLMVLKDGDSTFNVYQGINANNPKLTYDAYSQSTNLNSGIFIVTYPAVPPGKYLLLKFSSEDIANFEYSYTIDDSIRAQVPVSWQGDKNTILGKLHLFVCSRSATAPFLISSYDNYGEKEFYVDNNRIIQADFTAADIAFNPTDALVNIRNHNFSPMCDNVIYFNLANNTNSDLFIDNLNYLGDNLNFIVPKVFPSNRMRITTYAPYGDFNYIQNFAFTPENSIVTFEGIPEVGMLTPTLNAEIDSTQFFTITGNTTASGIYVYRFELIDNFNYFVKFYTTTQQFTYPDLSEFGFNLKRGKSYRWFAQKLSPFSNLDDYLSNSLNKTIKNFNIQTNASYFTTLP